MAGGRVGWLIGVRARLSPGGRWLRTLGPLRKCWNFDLRKLGRPPTPRPAHEEATSSLEGPAVRIPVAPAASRAKSMRERVAREVRLSGFGDGYITGTELRRSSAEPPQ